jgi:hypothetical protein
MKKILNYLFEHKSLSREQAKEVLHNISINVYSEAEIAAFITVYLMRSILLRAAVGCSEGWAARHVRCFIVTMSRAATLRI